VTPYILINIWLEIQRGFLNMHKTDDYFVYNAGAAAAAEPWPRLPSLSLLPLSYLAGQGMETRASLPE